MTLPQSARLREIVLDIRLAKRHPSAAVRTAFSDVSDAECENVARKIEWIISVDNGQMAYKIIEAWHQPGSERNVVALLSGMLFPATHHRN